MGMQGPLLPVSLQLQFIFWSHFYTNFSHLVDRIVGRGVSDNDANGSCSSESVGFAL